MNGIVGCSIRRMDSVCSTNSLLRAEAELGTAPEGSVLIAECQTAGRGRLERSWEAPPGKALLLSVLLNPQVETARTPLISLGAALAVQDAIADSCQLSAVSCQLSAVSYQLSAISYQLSAISCQLSAISCQLSAISYQLSASTSPSTSPSTSHTF
ncbi:MAG: hypothetical protein V2A61_07565 [Calditrichota bacterium]